MRARKIFRQATKILKSIGGNHCSFMDTSVFGGVILLSIEQTEYKRGPMPGRHIIVRLDDEVVFDAEKTNGFCWFDNFDVIIYRPGGWEQLLEDDFFVKG